MDTLSNVSDSDNYEELDTSNKLDLLIGSKYKSILTGEGDILTVDTRSRSF